MQIEHVKFLKDYIIEIELSNHKIVYFDLQSLLKTARFKHIVSQEFFETGRLVNHRCISWDDVTEIQDYEMLGEEWIQGK